MGRWHKILSVPGSKEACGGVRSSLNDGDGRVRPVWAFPQPDQLTKREALLLPGDLARSR